MADSNLYLGFPISDDLLTRVQDLIQDLRATDNRRPHALRLFQVISDLSDEGFQHFFIDSLHYVGIGKVKIMAVDNAIKVGKKPVLSIVKRMVKGFSDEQLLLTADLLEGGLTVRVDA